MALILEQYESYLNENRAVLESEPTSIIVDNTMFKDYITALSEAIEDKDAREAFKAVAYREREVLQEAGDLLSGEGKAWAVMYFPILADVYQTPLISKLLTVFTTSQKRVAIPRKTVIGEIIKLDGTVLDKVELPSSSAVRPNKVVKTISEGKTNLFSLLSITDKAKINQRYFAITKLTLTDNDGTNTETKEIPVVIRADFSGNFYGEAQFTASGDGKVVNVIISGNVNFETGDIVLSKNIITDSSDTIEFQNATVECRINVYGADKGKVKIKLNVEDELKLQLDEDNTFFIELIDEEVQDFKDIYNIDLLASIMEVVKLQFQLNKDADVADLLKLSEPDMAKYGNTATVDYSSLPSYLTPANIADVFSLVVPKILAVASSIEKIAHVTPQYLVTDRKTAVTLEALQSFATAQMNTQGQGKVGPAASALQFTRFTILKSDSIDEGNIYVVYKANNKAAAALMDIVYKPLYIHKSDVNGVAKQYLKSRTAVEVADPRKLGVVKVVNNPYV